jgi:hypothetical protein
MEISCAATVSGATWLADNPEDCEVFLATANFCCDYTDLDNGCTFCADGAQPNMTLFPDYEAEPCATLYEEVPKYISADDAQQCAFIQDNAFFSCECPSLSGPIPGEVECEIFPPGCSIEDIDYHHEYLFQEKLFFRFRHPLTEEECLFGNILVDTFICQSEETRQALIPEPPMDESDGQIITVVVQPDQYPYETAWVILLDDFVVATSPVFSTLDEVTTEVTLEKGKEYTFAMLDSYGDGFYTLGQFEVYLGKREDGVKLITSGFYDLAWYELHTIVMPSRPVVGTEAPSTAVHESGILWITVLFVLLAAIP